MIEPLPGETEILKRCAKGHTEAFGSLVTHYQDVIFGVVYRMIANHEDARDVTQEVFIKAFKNIASFRARSRFATWLYSIAVNQAISHRRRQTAGSRAGGVQMSALQGRDETNSFQPPAHAAAPDQRLTTAETTRQIENAIASLDEDHRTVVLLRDIEGLDYNSISQALGCSRGTVKSRLHRARLELRRKLRNLAIA